MNVRRLVNVVVTLTLSSTVVFAVGQPVSKEDAGHMAKILNNWAIESTGSDFAYGTLEDLTFIRDHVKPLAAEDGFSACFKRGGVERWNIKDPDCRGAEEHLKAIEEKLKELRARTQKKNGLDSRMRGNDEGGNKEGEEGMAAPALNGGKPVGAESSPESMGQTFENQHEGTGQEGSIILARYPGAGGSGRSKDSIPGSGSAFKGTLGAKESGPLNLKSSSKAKEGKGEQKNEPGKSPQGENAKENPQDKPTGRKFEPPQVLTPRTVASGDVIATRGALSTPLWAVRSEVLTEVPIAVEGEAVEAQPFTGIKCQVGVIKAQDGHRLAAALNVIEPKINNQSGLEHWVGTVPLFWKDFTNRELNFIVPMKMQGGEARVFNVTVALLPIPSTDPYREQAKAAQKGYEAERDDNKKYQRMLKKATPTPPSKADLESLKVMLSKKEKVSNRNFEDAKIRRVLGDFSVDPAASNGWCSMSDRTARDQCIVSHRQTTSAVDTLWTMVKGIQQQSVIDRYKSDPNQLMGQEKANAQKFQENSKNLEAGLKGLDESMGRQAQMNQGQIDQIEAASNRRIEVAIEDNLKRVLARSKLDGAKDKDALTKRLEKLAKKLDGPCPNKSNYCLKKNRAYEQTHGLHWRATHNEALTFKDIEKEIIEDVQPALKQLSDHLDFPAMKFGVLPDDIRKAIIAGLPAEGMAPGSSAGQAKYVAQTLPIFRPLKSGGNNSHTAEYLLDKSAIAGSGGASEILTIGTPFLRDRDRVKTKDNPRGAWLRALVVFDVSKDGSLFEPAGGHALYFDGDSGKRIGKKPLPLGSGNEAVNIQIEKAKDDPAGSQYLWRVSEVKAAQPAVEEKEVEKEEPAPARPQPPAPENKPAAAPPASKRNVPNPPAPAKKQETPPPKPKEDKKPEDKGSEKKACGQGKQWRASLKKCVAIGADTP